MDRGRFDARAGMGVPRLRRAMGDVERRAARAALEAGAARRGIGGVHVRRAARPFPAPGTYAAPDLAPDLAPLPGTTAAALEQLALEARALRVAIAETPLMRLLSRVGRSIAA